VIIIYIQYRITKFYVNISANWIRWQGQLSRFESLPTAKCYVVRFVQAFSGIVEWSDLR